MSKDVGRFGVGGDRWWGRTLALGIALTVAAVVDRPAAPPPDSGGTHEVGWVLAWAGVALLFVGVAAAALLLLWKRRDK